MALKRKATELLDQLKSLYRPFFIRRTKREIFACKSSELSQRPLEWHELPFKTDLVVWIPLSKVQKKVYQMIVENQSVRDDLEQLEKKHIFVIVLALKQVCVHPMLLLQGVYKDNLQDPTVEEEISATAKKKEAAAEGEESS